MVITISVQQYVSFQIEREERILWFKEVPKSKLAREIIKQEIMKLWQKILSKIADTKKNNNKREGDENIDPPHSSLTAHESLHSIKSPHTFCSTHNDHFRAYTYIVNSFNGERIDKTFPLWHLNLIGNF